MMHESTYNYLKPTEEQTKLMNSVRGEFLNFSHTLEALLPTGPDTTYLLRKLREVAMWANIAITRNPDGSPRT